MDDRIGRRVNVCGTTGSGKTTLGLELSRRLDVPFYELDAFHHGPNWTIRPVEEFRARVADAVAGDGWVIDGNYKQARDLMWPRTDTLIWLDYPLPTILSRLTRRTLRRWVHREELWSGNREVLWRHLFTRESLFLWALQTYRRRRRDCTAAFADPANEHMARIRICSAGELETVLGVRC